MTYCCNAAWLSSRVAALLGRFLPRLGPLVQLGGPFFRLWLFGCGAGDGKSGHAGYERSHHGFEVTPQPLESRGLLEAHLVHVERAVDLNLNRVLGLVRPAVVLGDVTSGI